MISKLDGKDFDKFLDILRLGCLWNIQGDVFSR